MTSDIGWTEDPTLLLRYQVLPLMIDENLTQSSELAATIGTTPEAVGHAIDILASAGFVQTYERAQSETFTGEGLRLPAGRSEVARWDSLRIPSRTKRACTAALLSWLDAQSGGVRSTEEFAGDVRAHYFGVQFPVEMITDSAQELIRHDLITGTVPYGGPVLRAAITPLGSMVVMRHQGDLVEWLSSQSGSGPTFNITHSTGVAVASNSPGTVQTINVSTDVLEDLRLLAGALDRLRDELTDDPVVGVRLAGIAQQLDAESAVAEPDGGRVKRLVNAAREIAINAGGGAAAVGIVGLVDQILHAIGAG